LLAEAEERNVKGAQVSGGSIANNEAEAVGFLRNGDVDGKQDARACRVGKFRR